MKKVVFATILSVLGIASVYAKDHGIVEEGDTYSADYVIIGSGPSGAPIAKLLSDDKKRSVIVIEAGLNHNNNPLVKYGKNITEVVFNHEAQFSWLEQSFPQTNLGNRPIPWITGRVLGGASAVNGTFWIRGTDQLYSEWKKFGGKKWTVGRINRVRKYLEYYKGKSPNPEYRGHHGRVHVRQPQETTPTGLKFAQAISQATGTPILTDYNNPKTPLGTDPRLQWSQSGHNGKYRVSSATAFLGKDVMTKEGNGVHGRKLKILLKTTALRTIWDGNTAIGVEVLQEGKKKRIFARKKVIVCSGINSSKFLMLSGIGPKKMLESFDIPVVFHNPHVGVGLQDQPAVTTVWSANPDDPTTPPGDPSNYVPFISFLPDPSGKEPNRRAVQIVAHSFVPGTLVLGVILCNEKSKGFVKLQSNDPLQMPHVNLAILENPNDFQEYVNTFRTYILAIANQMNTIDPTYQLLVPDAATINDDTLLGAYIIGAVDVPTSVHNYTTHCKMAPFKKGGVVDGKGHVHGVRNLIVADPSIAPTTTDGACMEMAYMVGTNIALQILEEEGEKIDLPHIHK